MFPDNKQCNSSLGRKPLVVLSLIRSRTPARLVLVQMGFFLHLSCANPARCLSSRTWSIIPGQVDQYTTQGRKSRGAGYPRRVSGLGNLPLRAACYRDYITAKFARLVPAFHFAPAIAGGPPSVSCPAYFRPCPSCRIP